MYLNISLVVISLRFSKLKKSCISSIIKQGHPPEKMFLREPYMSWKPQVKKRQSSSFAFNICFKCHHASFLFSKMLWNCNICCLSISASQFYSFPFAAYRESFRAYHTEWLHHLVLFFHCSLLPFLFISIYLSLSLSVSILTLSSAHFGVLIYLGPMKDDHSELLDNMAPCHLITWPVHFPVSRPPPQHTHTMSHTCSLCFIIATQQHSPYWSCCCTQKCTTYSPSHNNDDIWSSERLEKHTTCKPCILLHHPWHQTRWGSVFGNH